MKLYYNSFVFSNIQFTIYIYTNIILLYYIHYVIFFFQKQFVTNFLKIDAGHKVY